MIYTFPAVLTPSPEEHIVYASVPDLSHCISTGKDIPDAIRMITDALHGCLLTMEEAGVPIPCPSDPQELPHTPTDILTAVKVDTLVSRR